MLSNENHQWFHKQSKADQKRMNEAFQRYKAMVAAAEITPEGRIGNQVMMDLEEPGEFIEIPLYPNKEEREEER